MNDDARRTSEKRSLSGSLRVPVAWISMAVCLSIPSAVLCNPIHGEISSDSTWSGTVEIDGDILVQCGARLTVLPGTEIRFSANSSSYDDLLGIEGLSDLIVLGALTVEGGPGVLDSIVFRSDGVPGGGGNWGKILVPPVAVDSLCVFRYACVEHGTIGLEIDTGQFPVEHCRFSSNSSGGFCWRSASGSQVLSNTVFSGNAGYGLWFEGGDSLATVGCRFEDNATGLLFAGSDSLVVSSCTFDGNTTGLSATADRMVTIDSTEVLGSTTALDVTSNSDFGGVYVEDCRIEGDVMLRGRGLCVVRADSIWGLLQMDATDTGDTLVSWVERNQVAGGIQVRSRGNRSLHESHVYGNSASSILAYSASWSGGDTSFVVAVIDSNDVIAAGDEGITGQAGDLHYYYGVFYKHYGCLEMDVTRNVVTGPTTGIYAWVQQYDVPCGKLLYSSGSNTISSCDTGIFLLGRSEMVSTSDGDVITACGTGLKAETCALEMRSCRVTGNADKGLDLSDLNPSLLGGSLGDANDIYDNNGLNVAAAGPPVAAPLNWWGTVDEDSLVAMFSGPVGYSPWTDESHTGTYTTNYVSGVITGSEVWTGDVTVIGDVLVPSGSSLTIDAGCAVKVWAGASDWDTLDVTEGRCDLIVEGELHIAGDVSDSVTVRGWLPFDVVVPAGGQWGTIAFLGASEDSLCLVEFASLVGATSGIRVVDASPLIRKSLIDLTSGDGVLSTGAACAHVDSCQILGSGSGAGVSVLCDSAGGIRLSNSTVESRVSATGSGIVEIYGSILQGDLWMEAELPSDTLVSWVERNQIAGEVRVRSRGNKSLHESHLYGNTASEIDLYSASWNGGDTSYVVATVDSNEVVCAGTDGIVAQGGDLWHYYGAFYKRYGRMELVATRNVVTGPTTGIHVWVPYYSGTAGEFLFSTGSNTVSDCETGISLVGGTVSAASLDGDVITGCGTGLKAENCALEMRSCVVTGNTEKGLDLSNLNSSLIGGSLVAANDLYDNGQNIVNVGLSLAAPYNWWGTVDEDSLVATLIGPVGYSPWTDASHTGVYTTAYLMGVITGATAWSGEVKVAGDVVIPSGSSLAVEPGCEVKMWANACQWDTLDMTAGLCDLIVEGTLRIAGNDSDSVSVRGWLPLQVVPEGAGQWGSIACLGDGSDSAYVVEYATLEGATAGIRAVGTSLLIRHCLIDSTSGNGVLGSGAGSMEIDSCEIMGSLSGTCVSVAGDSTGLLRMRSSMVESKMSVAGFRSVAISDNSSLGQLQVSVPDLADSTGRLILTDSDVAGLVSVTGAGTVEIRENSISGDLEADVGGSSDSLVSWVDRNDIAGTIRMRSSWLYGYHECHIYGNTVSTIDTYVWPGGSGQTSYMVAEIDSNTVVSTTGDGILLRAGNFYSRNWVYYFHHGHLVADVTRNTVTAPAKGVYANVAYGISSSVGSMAFASASNVISGCMHGVYLGVGPGSVQTLNGDVITGCDTGVLSGNGALDMRSCVITGCTTQGVNLSGQDSILIGGSLLDANYIYANNDRNLVVTGTPAEARFNYWGAVAEDSVIVGFSGPVGYSPWTDSVHAGVYTTGYKSGVITGNEVWLGEVKLVGDVLIPPGSSLSVGAGSQVKMWAGASQWDTLGVTSGRCDLIAEGELHLAGEVLDSVYVRGWSPLEDIEPEGGQWGSVAFLGGSQGSTCVVEYGDLVGGTVGIRAIDSSPVVRNSLIGLTSGDGVKATSDNGLIGLRLEDCEVGGRVHVAGSGRADLSNNTLLSNLDLDATGESDSLVSWIRLNSVTDGIFVTSSGDTSHHECHVLGNTTSRIDLYVANASSYIAGEVDSNEVMAAGGTGIRVYGGAGHIDADIGWNTITSAVWGMGLTSSAGNVVIKSESNEIRDCEYGVYVEGNSTMPNVELDGEVLVGAPACDWAVRIQSADSVTIVNCDSIIDWTNGIYIGDCAWAEIASNQLSGRQEGFGVKCIGSSPEIRDNYIDNFLTAIHAESYANPHVVNNSLACATEWGLNNISAGVVVDADSNFWGDPSGPYHPTANPAGTGSWVSDNVVFAPWLLHFPNRSPRPFSLTFPGPGDVLDTVPVFDWEDAVDPDCHDVVFYTLHLSEDSAYSDPMVVPGLPESEYAFPESLFVGGVRYFWKVGATDGEDSIWCNEGNWGFDVDAVPPGTPQQVAGEGLGTGVKVFWDPNPESDLAYYKVYRGPDSTFTVSEAETIYATADTTITLSGLDSCAVYYFRVTALDWAQNESEASPVMGVCPAGAGVTGPDIPKHFMVSRASPNPSVWGTRIDYALPARQHVSVVVYDVEGRLVEILVNKVHPAGRYSIHWGEEPTAAQVPAGVYFLKFSAGNNTVKRKIVILR